MSFRYSGRSFVSMLVAGGGGITSSFVASAGRTGANAASPTARIRIGPTTLTGAEAYIAQGLTTTNPGGSFWQGSVVIHTIGAAGKANGGGQQSINTSSSTGVLNNGRNVDAAVNTTVANLVELTFKSGNVANVYTFNMATITFGRSSQ